MIKHIGAALRAFVLDDKLDAAVLAVFVLATMFLLVVLVGGL